MRPEAYALACEIEWVTAKRLAKAARTRDGVRLDAGHFYDPHAATELGRLIDDRIPPRLPKQKDR